MLNQIQWHNPGADVNPFSHLNLVRFFVQWKNGRQMDQYIGAELDKRHAEYQAEPDSTKSKSVIDLVLQAYMKGLEKPSTSSKSLDPNFRAVAIRQIRL